MQLHGINFDDEAIAAVCRRFGAARLSVFGSILTGRFGPESDVDLLVEFPPTARINLLDMVGMEQELSTVLGRKVDLRTPQDLSKYFRDEVMREARLQYAA